MVAKSLAYEMREPVIDRRAKIRGAAAMLFTTLSREVLFDGPAGTGKTYGLLRYCDYMCRRWPGIRILAVRETLHSLRESVQQIFEDHILWPGHPIFDKGGSRGQRSFYEYPNGSRIVLAGLDTPELLMSTEYDIIALFEATNPHVTERAFSLLSSRCRGMNIPHPECEYPTGVLPDGRSVRQGVIDGEFPGAIDRFGKPLFMQRIICDCNPDSESHWLWRRFEQGHMERLASLHEDNPTVQASYLATLETLPSPLYERLRLGQWVSSQNVIWPTYKPSKHLLGAVNFHMETLTGRRFVEIPDWKDDAGLPAQFPVSRVIAGLDWGHTSPGALEVFAITPQKQAFQLAEYYAVEKGFDWWAERISECIAEFKLERVLADPAAPGNIKFVNELLGAKGGRSDRAILVGANNARKTTTDRMGGLDLVRQQFKQDRLYLNRTALRLRDKALDEAHLPYSVVGEITSYCFRVDAKTGHVFEEPPDNAVDHGCDGVRYLSMDAWDTSIPTEPELHFIPPEGSIVYRVGTPEERMRLKKLADRRSKRMKLY